MSNDRKKIFGMEPPEKTITPKPLFSSQEAAARVPTQPVSVAPLFSGGTTGRAADSHVVQSPKPLMAQAVVRVRVTVSAADLQSIFPATTEQNCQTASRLVSLARLEADAIGRTVSGWGEEEVRRFEELTVRANSLFPEELFEDVSRVVQSNGLALQQLSSQIPRPETDGWVTRVVSAMTRNVDAHSNAIQECRANMQCAGDLASHKDSHVEQSTSLTKESEVAHAAASSRELAGRFIVQHLSQQKEENVEYIATLNERISRIVTARTTFNDALRQAWDRQAEADTLFSALEEQQELFQVLTKG